MSRTRARGGKGGRTKADASLIHWAGTKRKKDLRSPLCPIARDRSTGCAWDCLSKISEHKEAHLATLYPLSSWHAINSTNTRGRRPRTESVGRTGTRTHMNVCIINLTLSLLFSPPHNRGEISLLASEAGKGGSGNL